jgi:protein-S-isoprenylcysteine O-methyltransferase Ste14
VGCCLTGCVRLLLFALWRALFAALLAVILARIDTYVEERHGESMAGRAWRAYRQRGAAGVRRGTPPGADSAIDTEGRPRP